MKSNKSRVQDSSGKNFDRDAFALLENDPDSLSGAHLSHAQLNHADLRGADLTKADLSHADLTQSDLRGADLRYASLESTDLRASDLRGANLKHVKLDHTKLKGAIFDGKSDLPFHRKDAVNIGMVYLDSDGEPDVAVTKGEDEIEEY